MGTVKASGSLSRALSAATKGMSSNTLVLRQLETVNTNLITNISTLAR